MRRGGHGDQGTSLQSKSSTLPPELLGPNQFYSIPESCPCHSPGSACKESVRNEAPGNECQRSIE